jgi:hypothetical protein
MLDFLKKKYIGIDFFYNQIRAVDYKEGIIYDESVQSLYEKIVSKNKNSKIESEIKNFKYMYHMDAIYILFKNLIKEINQKVVKPIVVLAIPSEIKHSNYGEMWLNNIENLIMSCNIDSLILIESIICASYSLKIPFTQPLFNNLFGKYLIIHQTEKATVLGILFKGDVYNTRVIEKPSENIKLSEILDQLMSILDDDNILIDNIVKQFEESEKDIVRKSWEYPVEKVIHTCAPIELCKKLNNYIDENFDDYKINCVENYETSMIKGLENILVEIYTEVNN